MNKLVSSPDINASLIDQHKIKEDTYVTTIPLLPLLMIAMFKKKSSSSRNSKFWQRYDQKNAYFFKISYALLILSSMKL